MQLKIQCISDAMITDEAISGPYFFSWGCSASIKCLKNGFNDGYAIESELSN